MTRLREVMAIALNGERVSTDDMHALVAEVEAYLKGADSPAGGAELLGVMSAMQCRNELNGDDQAEAMRCGFRLALYLARFDFPMVQRAIARGNQGAGVGVRKAKTAEKHEAIQARALDLHRGGMEWRNIPGKIESERHEGWPKRRQIREIIKPIRPD